MSESSFDKTARLLASDFVDPDYTKEAEALLDKLFGPAWRVNPRHDDGYAVGVCAAALRRAEARGMREAAKLADQLLSSRYIRGMADLLEEEDE
jgi:hypothetical protein